MTVVDLVNDSLQVGFFDLFCLKIYFCIDSANNIFLTKDFNFSHGIYQCARMLGSIVLNTIVSFIL